MKNPESFSFEAGGVEQREKGANVFLRASFERHGEKVYDPNRVDTPLTEGGKRASQESGRARDSFDVIKGLYSPTERTEETLQEIITHSSAAKKMKSRKRQGLAFSHSQAFADWMSGMKKEIVGDHAQLTHEELRRRVVKAAEKQTDAYFALGDRRYDDETLSPVEAAAKTAREVDKYIRMTDRLKSGSNVEFPNTTHDFSILAFLKEAMIREVEGKRIRGFDTIKDIGGPLDYNEKFEVDVHTDAVGEKTVTLYFRGQIHEVDMDRLRELVEIAKGLEKEKESEKHGETAEE